MIETLQVNIQTEKKLRGKVEKEVQEKTKEIEMINKSQSEAIRDLEANLNAGNLEIRALDTEIAKLKTEIVNAKSKQQSLDELNEYLAEILTKMSFFRGFQF